MANSSSYLGDLDALYQYDPYGRVLSSTGPYAEENPFRFSTKYTDSETGLVYFGKRYYSPEIGRWINRDPIEEEGAMNIYAYVNDDPIRNVDPLGLRSADRGASEAAWEALANEYDSHFYRLYRRKVKIVNLFQTLHRTLNRTRVEYGPSSGNDAEYDPGSQILFVRQNPAGISVAHELVHRLDHLNHWYIGSLYSNRRNAEALAYGMEWMLSAVKPMSAAIERDKSCDKAQLHWHAFWVGLNGLIGTPFPYGIIGAQSDLTEADLRDVNAKLGLKFSCSALVPVYNDYLKQNGLKCCLKCQFEDFVLKQVFQ